MSLSLVSPIASAGSPTLDASTLALVEQMVAKWHSKLARNRLRQQYYDQKMLLQDLRIAVPPQLRHLEAVLGWPAKTVDVLADRINFERFVAPGEDDNPFGLDVITADNDFQNEMSQAVSSALVNSCAFVTITQGMDDEPSVLWMARSAEQATGLWNKRQRRLAAGMTVADVDETGQPAGFNVYLPGETLEIRRSARAYTVRRLTNSTGRVLMEPLVFKRDLGRPFGHSRISRSVISLTDSAVRTIVRSEVGAEFFTTPQRYVLGADESAFDKGKWQATIGTYVAMNRDEEGELPVLGQFQQQSMQPHTDQLRQWAALLAAESSIPLDELGFPSDNPSSDSAIQSQRDPLRLTANKAIRSFQSTLRNLAVTSVMLRDGLASAPDGLDRVSAWFAPTVHISDAAAADAVLKQVSVMPWLAESSVTLEKLGYSQEAIERLLADKRRSNVSQLVEGLRNGQADAEGQPAAGEDELNRAQVLKAKADALGVLRRAGVDGSKAAQLAGLEGVTFIPGNPITIRGDE